MLNSERVKVQRAQSVKRGIEMALGEGDLPSSYFDGICATTEEAASLEFDVNAARRVEERKRKPLGEW